MVFKIAVYHGFQKNHDRFQKSSVSKGEECSFTDGLCLSNVGLSGGIGFWWCDMNVHLLS